MVNVPRSCHVENGSGVGISFRVINKKTQGQFEIHSRIEKSLANILRASAKGMLADGLQSKAKMSSEAAPAYGNLQILIPFSVECHRNHLNESIVIRLI